MSGDLLQTKLYAPQLRPSFVPRPRLIERLNQGLQTGGKLTLISAPAGFGKTTLVSEWIAGCERPFAWLSLDERDNDLVRFLVYFIAALQTVSPEIGKKASGILESPQPPPTESILTILLNEIAAIPEGFALVLDDYHGLDAQPIDQALTFLLEHQPPQMHLVIVTREDPSLPLARLRARGQLTELRATDLRFTPAEAAEFLNRMMELNLSEGDIAALEARTEGWIAGLQLAALSMQGREDVSVFIHAFAGDNHYIVDYLVEEVLQRQSELTRCFLLQTAILDQMNGPLCEAVTGLPESKEWLQILERGNFFLIPLDDKRYWYRYHHLFAEVLQVYLMAEQSEQVATLHRRASEWYEQNGLTADAIRHALSAEDFERAAGLIERALPFMRQSRQESTLLGWLKALPDELFQYHPVLNAHYIGALLQNGQFDGVESRLRDVEQWLATPENIRERSVYVDDEDFQRLPSSVAMYHAAIALAQGDVVNAMKHARKALEHVRENDDFPRGAASSLLGLASWASGDLEAAYQMFNKGMAHLQRVGFISDVIGGSVTLADIRITQGRLHEAMSIYERGLQLATKQGAPALRGAADMHVGMSGLYHERNELNNAEQHLLKSKELGELNGLPKNPYRWRVAMARIRETQGDLDGAFGLLDEAESLYVGDFAPNVRPISALKVRVWVKQGELEKALAWARERKLSIEEDFGYLREFEQITFAKILLSQYQSDHSISVLHDAMGLLDRLLKAAEEGGRMGSVIEILILQALAHQLQEDIPAALPSLGRALKLAEPEGYMEIFLAEGSSMAELIREIDARGILPNYTRKLSSAFKAERKGMEEETPPSASPASSSLIEPLSQRELDILRLLKTELSGPEIAQELGIALSTVRTHTKSIYSKLNVNNRRGAVKRAIELGLI
jgi:LuxR family transcriptional regulator, maltose regulon positive regulatory protein